MEKTLVIVKSGAMARGLAHDILSRGARAGLTQPNTTMHAIEIKREQAEALYIEHVGRDYYKDLIKSVTEGPVVVAVFEADRVISRWRRLLGATDPEKAAPGSIRGDYGTVLPDNAAHGSDSPESAAREIEIFFPAPVAANDDPLKDTTGQADG